MNFWISLLPAHATKPAGIIQPQNLRSTKVELDMIVGQVDRVPGDQAQTAGHAEVQDQSTLFKGHNDVLATPIKRPHNLPTKLLGQLYRPAK